MAAGVDWTIARTDKPPLPRLCPEADSWLGREFLTLVRNLGRRMQVGAGALADLANAIEAANLRSALSMPRVSGLTNKGNPTGSRPVGRTEACHVLTVYLMPLLEPIAYRGWLDELARSQWFWRGGAPTSPVVPQSVARREAARDLALLNRWVGQPPQPPHLGAGTASKTQTAAERRYQSALAAYERNRTRAEAFLHSEPAAPRIAPPQTASRDEARLLEMIQVTAPGALPVLVFHGRAVPANLFISDVATPMADYLLMLEPILRAGAGEAGLFGPLMGLAYGMLALALAPLNCFYDNLHGTCAIEHLLPRLAASTEIVRSYTGRRLREAVLGGPGRRSLAPADGIEDKAVARALAAFSAWCEELAGGIQRNQRALARIAVDQSGGRVRTPVSVAPGARWPFTLIERQEDGSEDEVDRVAEEIIAYEATAEGASRRDAAEDAEMFWLIRAVWERLATSIALVNQAGMRFWFNAANNRWGGHHPPHRTHRQGTSIDFDIGFSWRPGHKVPNVMKRDPVGQPLDDELAPGNKASVDCLHGMNRVAGWIGTQAFLLVGVSQYLYGDAQLVEEASSHLIARLDEAGHTVPRPARLHGVFDAAGHNDHWHFELLAGRWAAEIEPYVFQVAEPELLNVLRAWAVSRDRDPAFWRKMAGLPSVPEKHSDFDKLTEAEDWRSWWGRGRPDPENAKKAYESEAGISLLPVWAPSQAQNTFDAGQCWDPKRDLPRIFEPGTEGA